MDLRRKIPLLNGSFAGNGRQLGLLCLQTIESNNELCGVAACQEESTHNCLRRENSPAVRVSDRNVVDSGRYGRGECESGDTERNWEEHLYQQRTKVGLKN